MRLDHIVFLVDDLDEAIVGWRREGYAVTPGGVHADGLTHNALICFSDGGYIELLAFRTPNAGAHRWARFRSFPGRLTTPWRMMTCRPSSPSRQASASATMRTAKADAAGPTGWRSAGEPVGRPRTCRGCPS